MAFLHLPNVAIKGISACVPKRTVKLDYYKTLTDKKNFIKATGISEKRVADESTTASDLCLKATNKLLEDLGWSTDSIDLLVFVSQTPDYIIPSTSYSIQDKLNLPVKTICIDISSGCSGYIYGLSVICSMLSCGQIHRALLLVGDTISKLCSVNDKTTAPLFGDAGSATAIEFEMNSEGIYFHLCGDGSKKDAIMIKDGGARFPFSNESFIQHEIEEGVIRSLSQISLVGIDVFLFGISKVPESVQSLISYYNIDVEKISFYVFHQANKIINQNIQKKLKINPTKVLDALEGFGNTSGASIPLTIVTCLKDKIDSQPYNLILSGFGVGLSWGSAYLKLSNPCICELQEI